MALFYIILSIMFILAGAFWGRVDGGGLIKINEVWERLGVMSAFVLACSAFSGWWGLIALLGVFGIATGHGQYFIGRSLVGLREGQETLDPIVNLFFDEDWRAQYSREHEFTKEEREYYYKYHFNRLFYRNAFGMFVTGSLVGLPSMFLAMVYGQWHAAIIFSLTGVAKSLAYVVGYKHFNNWLDRGTVAGEYINGGLRNILCLLVIAMVL